MLVSVFFFFANYYYCNFCFYNKYYVPHLQINHANNFGYLNLWLRNLLVFSSFTLDYYYYYAYDFTCHILAYAGYLDRLRRLNVN